jgi:hypothetical protein
MPLTKIVPLDHHQVAVYNAAAGAQTGSRITAVSHVRGKLIEAGFVPNSLVASAMTLAVLISANDVSSTASNFTQVVSSTLGTFSSTLLAEGKVASVVPPAPAYVNIGDAIQWVTSGGNTSAIGATVYAIIDAG